MLNTLDIYNSDSDVNLTRVTENQIEIFSKVCQNLKVLDVDYSFKSKCNKLYQCLGTNNPSLEALKITHDYDNNGVEIHDKEIVSISALECLAKGCLYLQEIRFECVILPNNGLNNIANYCHAITKIELDDCQITDTGMTEISKLPNLVSIVITHCLEVTNIDIESRFKSSDPHFKHIEMTQCDQLTDECLFTIATMCPNLNDIEIHSFGNINVRIEAYWEL